MPLEVFYSYSHKDAELRDQLDVHLSQLVHDGLIVPWVDRRIEAGDEWRGQIDSHVRSAQIILLLISPDFLASEYCYGLELKIALERHAKEHAVVIPIILRPSDWQSAPFAELQCLPREAKAVTLWANRDEAFAHIAQSIRETVTRFQEPKPGPVMMSELRDQQVARQRVVDAAMPGHIVKDRATELLVLIRLPESKGLVGVLQEDEEAEARPEDVRSRPFDVAFPLGPTGLAQPLKIAVQLTSPDFSPPTQSKNIFVPVNADSTVCPFLLTPVRTGPLLVVIELIWEDVERGSRRLRTTCVAEAGEAAVKPAMVRAQMNVGVGREEATEFPTVAAAAAAGGANYGAVPVARSVPAPSPVQALPPAPQIKPAPVRKLNRVRTPPPRRSFLSTPLAKVGMGFCVLVIGSSFFIYQSLQRGGSSAAPAPAPVVPKSTPVAPPPDAELLPVLSAKVSTAAAELDQVSKSLALPNSSKDVSTATVSEAVQEGQKSLAAARVALAKGDKEEARKHLARVETVNAQLRAIRKRRVELEATQAAH